MLQGLLVQKSFRVGQMHVATRMKRRSIEASCRRPNTSEPAAEHNIFPARLRKRGIARHPQSRACLDVKARKRWTAIRYCLTICPKVLVGRFLIAVRLRRPL